VALGHVAVDHEAYGALRLTESARPILRGECAVEMRRAPERPTERKFRTRLRANLTAQVDDTLLGRLRSWRAEEAKRQGVPAYVILHDATLTAIAQLAPKSLDALGTISGIGAKRLERYGEAVLALVSPAAHDTA
jgi:ATP-dependent DNA helicase RecQ